MCIAALRFESRCPVPSTPPRLPVRVPDGTPVSGTILLVANYESDVGYAWWLMENFWVEIADMARRQGRRCVLAYPRINSIPAAVESAPISIVEQRIDLGSSKGRTALRDLVREHGVTAVYLTDYPLLSPWYAWLRAIGVRRIVVHCHTPGDRPPMRGVARIAKRALHAARLPLRDSISRRLRFRLPADGGERVRFSGALRRRAQRDPSGAPRPPRSRGAATRARRP